MFLRKASRGYLILKHPLRPAVSLPGVLRLERLQPLRLASETSVLPCLLHQRVKRTSENNFLRASSSAGTRASGFFAGANDRSSLNLFLASDLVPG